MPHSHTGALTQRSGHGQEGDLVDDGAAAHRAVVGQARSLPHNTIHTGLVDDTENHQKGTGVI